MVMARMQITIDPEIQRKARQRASDLGMSLAEYVRRLGERDLGGLDAAGQALKESEGRDQHALSHEVARMQRRQFLGFSLRKT